MTTLQDLRSAVTRLLTICGYPGTFILQKNADDAAFEVYVFTLVLRAFRQAGGAIQIRSIEFPNSTPPIFYFRGSPGYIYSRRVDYGYAEIEYNGVSLEVHIDVEHRGSSGVQHEFDVSIISSKEGRKSRRSNLPSHPSHSETSAALECKFYSTNLQKSLIRELVGAGIDMGQLRIYRFVSNRGSPTIKQYCTGPNRRPVYTENLSPLNPRGEQALIDNLVEDIGMWLG